MGAPKTKRAATDDLAEAGPTTKRRRNATSGKSQATSIDSEDDVIYLGQHTKKKKSSNVRHKDEEKRLKRFRPYPPVSYQQKLERALSQRMFVIDRHRHEEDGIPEELVEMAGSTGNIYHVTISKTPSCTCPDSRKNGQCKHIIYVLKLVLKAPEQLQYQLAFLASELREIFEKSPLPNPDSSKDEDDCSNRKPIDGDCPICFMAFEAESEDIVWCKAACGNNVHKACFEQWAKSSSSREVKCVYCRSVWQGNDDSISRIKAARNSSAKNKEGYINVGTELGISSVRDHSSYHSFWVRRQLNAGETFETA